MKPIDRIAPPLKDLRPMRPERTATFPVYPELASRLADAPAHPDPTVAHVLATCSGYAYSDADTVTMMMARMGLENNHCREVAQFVDIMFISSTAFLIQSEDGRVVILCYRGTPITSLVTWLADASVDPQTMTVHFRAGTADYQVHGGFYRNVRATRYEVVAALDRAGHGRSVLADGRKMDHPLEALYITGHSMGAAMAAMMGVMVATEPAYRPLARKLRGVYTFAQAMIGPESFADACDEEPLIRDRMIRYVYANDIAPQLPPRESGEFKHFGQEYQYRRRGSGGRWQHNTKPRGQLRSLLEVAANPLSFVARQFPLTRKLTFRASVDDHLAYHYIAALRPEGVHTEFGD